MKSVIASAGLALAVAVATAGAGVAAGGKGAPATPVDSHGALHVPKGYQSGYQYMGTWAVAADKGPGSKEMHVVYASPGAIAAFKRTGHFPDGTVLVKEVFAAATAEMTTGAVSWPYKLKGWFVVVRDTKNDHPGNKLWGEGWGWSWFDAGQPLKTTTSDYRLACQGCHVPAKATDWMYTPGYPILRR